jgi:undecaprenyl-diphosphatase
MGTNGAEPAAAEGHRSRGASHHYRLLRLSVGRHPRDLILIAVAAGVVLGCLVVAQDRTVNPVEAAIFTQVERLPDWSRAGWRGISLAGWWPGIVVVAGLALYLARLRLSLALVASGAVSWFLASVIHWTTPPRPVSAFVAHTALRSPGSHGFDFPDARTAVAAALATAGAPYLGRFSRQALWAVAVLVGVADVYLGRNLPLGVFAGAVLGWGTGRLSHLVLGAPGRRASEESILLALRETGLDPVSVSPMGRFLLHPQQFEVVTADGDRLQMKLVRRLHRLAGPTYKLRRAAASLDTQFEPGLSTPRHEVEHEAYITLLAERAGVGVLPVLLAGEVEHGPPFLIRRHVDGRRLSSLRPEELDDDLLARIWRDVTSLGREHIAHHDLSAANVLVDTDGRPRIADFTLSRAGGPPAQAAQDVAEMLVSITSVGGVDVAVDSAVANLPQETLEQALPYLQWMVLHRRIRNQCSNP